jgi:hypothetical protein
MNIKELIFVAESVAHLQGYEREILPLTDRVREMYSIMKKMCKVPITACCSFDDEYFCPVLTEFLEFMRDNNLDDN